MKFLSRIVSLVLTIFLFIGVFSATANAASRQEVAGVAFVTASALRLRVGAVEFCAFEVCAFEVCAHILPVGAIFVNPVRMIFNNLFEFFFRVLHISLSVKISRFLLDLNQRPLALYQLS